MEKEPNATFEQARKEAEEFLRSHASEAETSPSLSQAFDIIQNLLAKPLNLEAEDDDLQYFEKHLPGESNSSQNTLDNHPAAMYRVRVLPAFNSFGNIREESNIPFYVFEFASKRFFEMFGMKQSDLKRESKPSVDWIYPDDKASFMREYNSANKKCRPFCWEGRILVREKVKWIRLESIPQKLANNEILWTGILDDFTDRKNTEDELFKTRLQLEDVLYGANVGTLEWNVQTGKVKFNEIWAKNLGYSLIELKIGTALFGSRGWKVLTHPDDIAYADEMLQRHFSGELPYHIAEVRMRHKKGHWVWMRQVGKVKTWTADGKPLQMYGIHTNIDDRKKSEIALSKINEELETRVLKRTLELESLNADLLKSEQKFRTISDFTYDWEYWKSEDNKMNFISPSVLRVTGYTVGEFENNPRLLDDIVYSYDRDIWKNHTTNRVDDAIEGDSQEMTFRIVTKNGDIRWISHVCRSIYIEGNYLGVRVSNRDITDKVNAERELLAVTVNVEENERNKFSSELHDGMGPLLSTIKLYFQWLSENKDEQKNILITEKGNQCIEAAIQTARELSRGLSSQLLLKSGYVVAIQDFVSRINETSKIKVRFITNSNSKFSHFLEITLYRITTELLKNTITYANASIVEINFEHSINSKLSLTYTDNGVGFDYKSIMNNNHGLGIMNIQQRVKVLKGSIDIQSAPKQGMTTYIQFPLEEMFD